MRLTVKAGQLAGAGKCYHRRSRELNFETEKSEPYLLASIVGEVIRTYVLGVPTGAPLVPLKGFIEDKFDDIHYDIPEAKDMAIKQMVFLIERWMKYDRRKFRSEPQKLVTCFNVDVLVSPTLVYENDDLIECIQVKYSKPQITQSSTTEGKGANTYLPLYALLQYTKTLVYPGHKKKITATILYLKRDDDKPASGVFKADFTDASGAKNVISLSEDYEGGSTAKSTLDTTFEWQFDEFFAGKLECSEEDCSYCDFNCVCKYNRAPRKLVKKKGRVLHYDEITLSASQTKVVAHEKGQILVNAGAGAGKTLCVAMHVVRLLMKGIKPEAILLITFTKNGAKEMLERVQYFVDDLGLSVDVGKIMVTTFNGFDNEILAKEYARFGFTEAPSLLEPEENAELISRVLTCHPVPGLDVLYPDRKATKNMISMGAIPLATKAFRIIKLQMLSKGDGEKLRDALGPYGAASIKDDDAYEELIAAYNNYESMMIAENYITYDDQEYYRNRLLDIDPTYYDHLGYSNIIVDEFQDTSDGQLDLIKVLMDAPTYEEAMFVGDDSQAIYAFRDTTNENILHLEEKLDVPVEQVNLLENFRSRPEIIELGNRINRLNPDRIDKDLVATRPAGGTVKVRGFFESAEELDYIASQVKMHIDEGKVPNSVAVIVRNRSQLEAVGTRLTALGIQWVSRAPMNMSDNSRVRAASALIRAYATPEATELYLPYHTCLCDGDVFSSSDAEIMESIDFLKSEIERIKALPPKESEEALMEMLDMIAEDDEVYESFLDVIKRKPGMQRKIDYVRAYEKYGKDKTKSMDADYPGVQLTTCHSAKGLEWENVILSLTGYDDESLHKGSKARDEIQEARRLVFVGITRAKDNLTVTGLYCLLKGGRVSDTFDVFVKEVFLESNTPYEPSLAEYELRKKAKAAERAAILKERKRKLGLLKEEEEGEKKPKKKAKGKAKDGEPETDEKTESGTKAAKPEAVPVDEYSKTA
jgi:DNA helicase-2/ATP-dependent DNA helicase PcrA